MAKSRLEDAKQQEKSKKSLNSFYGAKSIKHGRDRKESVYSLDEDYNPKETKSNLSDVPKKVDIALLKFSFIIFDCIFLLR